MSGAALPAGFFDAAGADQRPGAGSGELEAFLREVQTSEAEAKQQEAGGGGGIESVTEAGRNEEEEAEAEEAAIQHAYLNKVARLMKQKASLEDDGGKDYDNKDEGSSAALAQLIEDEPQQRASDAPKVEEMVALALKMREKKRKRQVQDDAGADSDLLSFSF